MTGHNPVLGRDEAFQPGGYATFEESPRTGGYGSGQQPAYGYGAAARQQAPAYGAPAPAYGQQAPGRGQSPSADELEHMYAQQEAGPRTTGRLTYEHVINITGVVLGTIVVAAIAAWMIPPVVGRALGATPSDAAVIDQGLSMLLLIGGLIGGLVLGLVNAFKRNPSPALILAYAVFEGALLGALSKIYETQWNGIVLQAVVATLAVFTAVLLLFRSGKVRTSPKLNKIFFVSMIGLLLFSVANIGLMLFGVVDGPFGLRNGILGLVIGVFAVLLASYALVMDFEDITYGVRNGAPRKLAWRAAFGLAVTLVWMYLEILRILAILREN